MFRYNYFYVKVLKYIYIYLTCKMSVFWIDPINVKTTEPIGSKRNWAFATTSNFLFLSLYNPGTSAPLVKVNSTYMKHKVNLVAPASPVHRVRYSTNWDRKGWPGLEIQMYYGCPWTWLYKPLKFKLWIFDLKEYIKKYQR